MLRPDRIGDEIDGREVSVTRKGSMHKLHRRTAEECNVRSPAASLACAISSYVREVWKGHFGFN